MNADGTGYLAQRSMACRSDRDASQAALVFTVLGVTTIFVEPAWGITFFAIALGLGLSPLFRR